MLHHVTGQSQRAANIPRPPSFDFLTSSEYTELKRGIMVHIREEAMRATGLSEA